MDISIFTDKEISPDNDSLITALGSTAFSWQVIRDFTRAEYPSAKEEWSYPGKKCGWSFRIKDSKRTIIYLLPCDGFFKVALLFGRKATEEVFNSQLSDRIKSDLQNATVYVERRGIRIDVTDESLFMDIKKPIEIKLAN